MKSLKYIILSFALLTVCLGGCNDDFLNLKNPNAYTEESYFTTADQLEQAVIAAYYGFYHTGLFAREWYFYHDMLGNDAKAAPAIVGTGAMGQLPTLTYDGTNEEVQNLWRSLYRIVLRATIALDKSKDFVPATADEERTQKDIWGESSYLKAWSYFALYRFWGRVPLRRTIEDMAIRDYPRCETEQDLVDYILELLADAETNLRVSWDDANLGRATRGAAVALRGQLYMWEHDYASALTEFEKLGQAPYSYALAPDYSYVCMEEYENNEESIFEIQHWYNPSAGVWYMFGGQESWGPDQACTGRAMEFGWNDWFNVSVSNSLVQSFVYDINGITGYKDPRAFYIFYGDGTYGGDTTAYCDTCGTTNYERPYPYGEKGYAYKKYQHYEVWDNEGTPKSGINTFYMRYADVLLQKAECHIQAGNNPAALDLINEVRGRAGAELYTDLGADPMAILMRERRLELSGEQVRFWDLIRWGVLEETLNPEKNAQGEGSPYQEKHRLFPIPNNEMEINQKMVNNLYYTGWN